MTHATFPACCIVLALAANLPAQADPRRLIEQEWPGLAVRTVTEAGFRAFAARHPEVAAWQLEEKFHALQYAACGLRYPGNRSHAFLLPDWTPGAAAASGGAAPSAIVCEAAEPNDRRVTATPMACGDTAKGQISSASDKDWYRFSVTGIQVVTGTMAAGTGCAGTGTAVAAANLDLFDDRGVLLGTAAGIQGFRPYPTLQRVLTTGTYYFGVRVPATQTGFYNLTVACSPAVAITCGTPLSGNIAAVNAFEYFTFNLTSPTDLTLVANSNGSALDSRIQLLTFGTHRIVLDSLAGPGTSNGTLLLRGLLPGTYLVGVTGESGSTGTYRLDSTCAATTVQPLPPNGTAIDTVTGRHEAVFHSLVLTSVSDVTVTSSTPSVNNGLIAIGFLDARGVPIGGALPGLGCPPTPGTAVRQALPAGQFMLFVGPALATTACPGSPSTYTLTAATAALTPTVLSPGDPAPGNIASPGQFEAFTYTLHTPSEGWMMLNSPPTPILDTYLTMFSGSGLYYAEDDDGGALRNDSLLNLWFAADTYLVTARAFLASATGTYEAIAGAETEIVGTGTVNTNMDFRWRGAANDIFVGFWSPGPLAPLPTPFPGQFFLLNPARFFVFNSGPFPAAGIVEILQVPVDPALVGATLAMQSLVVPGNLDLNAVHLTNGDSIRFQ